MKKDNEIIKLDDIGSVMRFLQEPTAKLAEAMTGILASDTKDLKMSAGRLVSATIRGKLLTQLGVEFQKYRKEGRIEEDFLSSAVDQASFSELLKFIDDEVPDEHRFRAMKSVFFCVVEKGSDEEKKALGYEILKITKQLSSTEVRILRASFDIVHSRLTPEITEGVTLTETNPRRWANLIAKKMGHDLQELIEVHEEHLVLLKLITQRQLTNFGQKVGELEPSPHFRLTPLGMKVCEFISKYE